MHCDGLRASSCPAFLKRDTAAECCCSPMWWSLHYLYFNQSTFLPSKAQTRISERYSWRLAFVHWTSILHILISNSKQVYIRVICSVKYTQPIGMPKYIQYLHILVCPYSCSSNVREHYSTKNKFEYKLVCFIVVNCMYCKRGTNRISYAHFQCISFVGLASTV